MFSQLKTLFSSSGNAGDKARVARVLRRAVTGSLLETLESRMLLSAVLPVSATAALNAAIMQQSLTHGGIAGASAGGVQPSLDTAPVISSANQATFYVEVGGTFTVVSQASPVASWTETGALPTGVSFVDNNDGTATFTIAPTTAAGTISLTLTASNGTAPDAVQSFALHIVQPTVMTVTNLADSGLGSLREVITNANLSGGEVLIKFAPGVRGTVNLLSKLPDISANVIMIGTGVTVNGKKTAASVFTVDAGFTSEFHNMTITGGGGATGGGINNAGTLAVISSTITGNTAGEGGGIFNAVGGNLTITNSTLSGNRAIHGGGGMFSSGTASAIDSTFSGNSGGTAIDSGGGGIASQGGGTLSVTNCTIANNTADYAGGISNDGPALIVTDCTVVLNKTMSDQGGINTFSTVAAIINGTIVALNSQPDVSSGGAGGLTGSFDLIGDGSDLDTSENPVANLTNTLRGTYMHPLNPQLKPLASNGGPTQTMAETTASPGIAKGANFPVLDASNGDITATDQRGVVRPRASGIDIGAFQLPPAGAATRLLIVPVVTTVVAGATIGTKQTPGGFVVKLINAKGQIDTSNTSSVTIVIETATGGATAGTPVTVQAVAGIATFNGLVETQTGSFMLVASDANLTPGKSNHFTVTADTATAHLVMVHQPGATVVGAPLKPSLVVEIQDQFSNIVTTDHSKVTLTKISGPGTLGGTTTVTAIKGVATFSKAFLSTAGSYTLAASDSSLVLNPSVQFAQIISQGATSVAAPHAAASYIAGHTIDLSTTFKSSAPTSIPFTGSASILDQNNVVLGTAVVSVNGAIKFVLTDLVANTYVCTISYPGDTNHSAITSATFTLLVKS